MGTAGFTLLELTMSVVLIVFVSALGFVAVQTTADSVTTTQVQTQLQGEARSIIISLSREVEPAVQPVLAGEEVLPPNVEGLQVLDGGRTLRFQTPTNALFTTFSAPITIAYENEDLADAESGSPIGNAVLDDGEDTNEDGALTRRLVRRQGGATEVLGAGNSVADVRFELQENGDVLRVTLLLTTPMGNERDRLIRYQIQEDIYLMN